MSRDLGDDLGWPFYIWGNLDPEAWYDFSDYVDMDKEESGSDFMKNCFVSLTGDQALYRHLGK